MLKNNLEEYNFPEDLKKMSLNEMQLLSCDIRNFLIQSVSKTGGHLASNLGVVELSIALHRSFDSPNDKIIWDVGHQSYVHKILTGRSEGFKNLRKIDGMSGFPKHCESPHDIFETGHSSTSLSAAYGIAKARDLQNKDYHVIPVIGDGALTGGMAYEALNNIGESKTDMTIILNDNEMSISPNIGGVSEHLVKLRTSGRYRQTKKKVKNGLNRIPAVGEELSNAVAHAKDMVKYAVLSGGAIFEELGITYLGPVDGHNIEAIMDVLSQAKKVDGPVLIHVLTKKGRGYINAENNPDKFHGIGPFDPETGALLAKKNKSFSNVFGEVLMELGRQDNKVVAVTAAMKDATGLGEFSRTWKDRCFDVGIAEQHAVTFAAGLATGGMKPFVAIYSTFLQRAYDQIIEDVCLQNLPVVFGIDRAGIVGADGETHQGVFDITYLMPIPNISIFAPADGAELKKLMHYAYQLDGPVALRYPRGSCGNFEIEPGYSLPEVGRFKNQRQEVGNDIDIWAVGSMLEVCLEAARLLSESGVSAGVVSVQQLKPLEVSALTPSVNRIFTVEDGMVAGGFGEHLSAELGQDYIVKPLGWGDQFIEHGSTEDLYRRHGLDARGIADRILLELGRQVLELDK